MKTKTYIPTPATTHALVFILRLALLYLWVPVAVDKLWDLSGFHHALLRQPFPNWWAGILFWLLPLLELLAAVLIGWRHHRRRVHQGMWLSAVLMLGFTLFILFGVLGWYAQRPCGCGSVISGLSWEDHLWFNIVFLVLSGIGIWLTRARGGGSIPYRKSARLLFKRRAVRIGRLCSLLCLPPIRFPRKFAVFRRRAVQHRSRCWMPVAGGLHQ